MAFPATGNPQFLVLRTPQTNAISETVDFEFCPSRQGRHRKNRFDAVSIDQGLVSLGRDTDGTQISGFGNGGDNYIIINLLYSKDPIIRLLFKS